MSQNVNTTANSYCAPDSRTFFMNNLEGHTDYRPFRTFQDYETALICVERSRMLSPLPPSPPKRMLSPLPPSPPPKR
ncbi:uncharacterized protein NPIL_178471, partial [Nephila pilipes]